MARPTFDGTGVDEAGVFGETEMIVANLAFFVLLGQAPTADPVDLVQQLGSARYAERQEATAALERLGRKALPALREAREQRDPEVRSRATALLARIEGSLLTQPSLVSLQFRDAELPEVVRAFSEQTGIKLVLLPENSPLWKGKRVTIDEPEPLPFWKALDRLCDAAGLQFNYGVHATPNGREPSLALFSGAVRPALPTSDTGPFRVSVVSLHHSRDVTFPPMPPNARNAADRGSPARPSSMISEQFNVHLQIAAEPRLSLLQVAPLRVTEAIDDRGNSLAIPAAAGADIRRSGYFGFATGSVVPMQAALNHPASPGTMIRTLKGSVPVMVSTRKPSPLAVPLAKAAGRTFQNDEVAVTVHEVHALRNNRPASLEVTIRPIDSAAGGPGGDAAPMRPDMHQQQLEIADQQGHTIPWYQSNYDAEAGRITITLTSPEQAANLGELRYYGLVRATTEVPFEFSDLTMP